jgi:hypothetical protein
MVLVLLISRGGNGIPGELPAGGESGIAREGTAAIFPVAVMVATTFEQMSSPAGIREKLIPELVRLFMMFNQEIISGEYTLFRHKL